MLTENNQIFRRNVLIDPANISLSSGLEATIKSVVIIF